MVLSVFHSFFYWHAIRPWVAFVFSPTDTQGCAFMLYAWHEGFSFQPRRPLDVSVAEQTDSLTQGDREDGASVT